MNCFPSITRTLNALQSEVNHKPCAATDEQCLKNRGEGDILCKAYAFIYIIVSALKSFFLTFIYTFLFSLDIKNIPIIFSRSSIK